MLLAGAAVLTELGVAAGLWFARTRWLAAGAGLLLHTAITVAMWSNAWALVAFAVACLAQYPMFLVGRPQAAASTDAQMRPDPTPLPRSQEANA